MKIRLRLSIGILLCGLLFWTCTNKEINLVTNIDFEVSITNQEDGFVKDSLVTEVMVIPDRPNYPGFVYSLQYKVTTGSGYFVAADQTRLKEEESYVLDPEQEYLANWKYIGTTLGTHRVTLLAQDNFEKQKSFNLQYELKNLDLTWDATTAQTMTKIGDTLALDLSLINNDAERLVTFAYSPRVGQGVGTFLDADFELLEESVPSAINEGSTPLFFVPQSTGVVRLIFDLTDSNGQELSTFLEITVLEAVENIPPIAVVNLADGVLNKGEAPYEVRFVGESSSDSDGAIVSYLWQFNDEDGTTATEQNPIHTFQTPGTYSVQLTVTDNEAAQNRNVDTNTITIIVEETMSEDLLAVDDAIAVEGDESIVIAVLENDQIAAGTTVTISALSEALNGVASIGTDQSTITYRSNEGFSGTDSFTYTISDSDGTSSTAEVIVTVSITNAIPVAIDDTITTDENIPIDIAVLENDTDSDMQVLQLASTTTPTNGTIVENTNGTITYTPNAGFDGVDSFDYTITDGVDTSEAARVTITVIDINQPPMVEDFEAMTNDLEAIKINILEKVTDDENDPVTIIEATALNGEVVNNGDGTITYTPVIGFGAVDQISFVISDGVAGNEVEGKIRVDIILKEVILIPDVNFEQALIDLGYDSDNTINGQISRNDALRVSELKMINKGITTLSGIEGFTELKNLEANANNFPTVDLAKNKKLTRLFIGNGNLMEIDISKNIELVEVVFWINKLREIDVTQNTKLEVLNLGSNDIRNIDLSKNLLLNDLKIDNNQLSELNITKNIELTRLQAGGNLYKNLNIRENKNLIFLNLSGTEMSTIDISKNVNLEGFTGSNSKLSTLDFTNNLSLTSISLNNTLIEVIDLSLNTSLSSVSLKNNPIKILDLKDNISLDRLELDGTKMMTLDLSKNTKLTFISVSDNKNLTDIGLRNGSNDSISYFKLTGCDKLTCVQVDNVGRAVDMEGWVEDTTTIYTEAACR